MTAFSFDLGDFVLVWWALLYEALPFVLIGSVAAGFVERCLSEDRVTRLFPKHRGLGIVASACLGLIFPMCECGIVPVVRRLVRKGVPVSCGVAYMLASPIVNPLVILSTAVAFRPEGGWRVAAIRSGMGLAVAVALGVFVWKLFGEDKVLLPGLEAGNAGNTHGLAAGPGSVLGDALSVAAGDFIEIGAYLAFGTAIAALINSGLSRAVMEQFAERPAPAVGGMMGMAVMLNLCSEADAFVAASFRAFPLAPKMAFLVMGPMIDVKLLIVYTTVFRPKAIVAISGLTALLIFLLCITGYGWMPALALPGAP